MTVITTSPLRAFQSHTPNWRIEQPSDPRIRAIFAYIRELRNTLHRKIESAYFFKSGVQENNEKFQDLFIQCFAQIRGEKALVEAASNELMYRFEYEPDICIRSESWEDGGDYRIGEVCNVTRQVNPELEKKLFEILEKTQGLQKELLAMLNHKRREFKPGLTPNTAHITHDREVRPWFVETFSWVIPKYSDFFKDVLSKLLQLAWIEEQLGLIQIPTKAIVSNVEMFRIGNLDYLVKKTCDDGACALHALLGEPIDGEYRYPGPGNVRDLFIERLKEHVSTSPTIRTLVTNILYSHLNTLDGSSKMLFSGNHGEALRVSYLLMKTNVDQFIRTKKQEESLIWQQQIRKPHIQKELLAATKTKVRYARMSNETILKNLEEYPELILSIVDESPGDFLRLLEAPVYWQIFNIRSQREECFSSEGIAKKVFAMRHLYPHYLEVIKDSKYFFNTEELELAAIIFDKKMIGARSVDDKIVPATKMINGAQAGDPIIIYHEGAHFSRCKPVEKSDAEEMLYQSAQKEANNLIEWDRQASDRLKSTIRTEAAQILVSGTVSLARKNPWWISGQLMKSVFNIFGTMVDPFNEQKSTEFVKLVANSAGSFALGQAPMQVGKALVIDAFVTLTAPQEMTRTEQAQRSYYISILKGIGGDEKEIGRAVFGGCVSAASVFLTFKQKEGEGWGWTVLKVLPTNSDFQNGLQDGLIKAFTKDKRAALPPPTETPEEKQAREEREAKIQEIEDRIRNLEKELLEIEEVNEPTLEDTLAGDLSLEGKSSGGMAIKKDKALEPVSVEFESPEPPHVIRQRIDTIIQELKQKDEDIRIGTENVRNLQSSPDIVDNANYEVRKQSGNWRVYRNGLEVFKAKGKSSRHKEKCYQEIPNLKKTYGTSQPSQETNAAVASLNLSTEQHSGLLQKLKNEQQKFAQVDSTFAASTMDYQPAIPTVQITPQSIDISLSMKVNKVHTSRSDKEYLIYMNNSQGEKKLVGKFSSDSNANSFFNEYNDYISRINNLNKDVAQTQSHYYTLGLDSFARGLKAFEPIYIAITAAGKKSKVYEGDRKVLSTESRNEALTEAKTLLSDDITSHEKRVHAFKTEMAKQIFSTPRYSAAVKQAEANRILREQQQQTDELKGVKLQGQGIQHAIPKAIEKAEKIQKETGNSSSVKKFRREKDALDAIKQLRVDESSNGERAGDVQKRIEDNNFLLQIAQGNTSREEVNAVRQNLQQKKIAKNTAAGDLEDKTEKFQKTKKDRDHKKAKEATTAANQTTQELDEALKRYYELQGVDYTVSPTSKVKPPEKSSGWDKTKTWINNNVSVSGEANVLTVSSPELNRARGEPSLFHYDLKSKAKEPRPSYQATRYEIGVQRSQAEAMESSKTKTTTASSFNLPQATPQPFDPNVITIPNPFCPGLAREIAPRASTPKAPAPMKTPMYISPSFIPPAMPPQFPNQFIPTEVGGLAPVQMPTLPPPERPTQTETSLVTTSQPKSFGSIILRAAINPFDPNGIIELGHRVRVGFFPQEQSQQISSLTGFDPGLQAKYPEVYALATNLDQFGRREVSLFRVTMEELSSRNKPRVLKEFSDIASFLEKATGHSLYTRGIHPETREPVAVRIEKIAVAAVSEARNVLEEYNRERINNPLQSQADLILSLPRTGGRLAKDFVKLLNALVRVSHPEYPEAMNMDHNLDALAGFIDGHYVNIIHSFYPTYDPNSASSRLGNFIWEVVPVARAVSVSRLAMRSGAVASRVPMYKNIVTAEEAIGKRIAERAAFLERMNNPVYRSGIVTEGTVAKLTERQIRVITPVKLSPVQVGEELTWLSNNLPKVRQLQQVKGMDRFDQFLKATFRDQNLSETQIRRVLNCSGFKTYPRPIGLPENIVVELSKKNGGMTFRLAGTTDKQNLVVRVCPGLAEESMVSSVLKGNHLNGKMKGTLRQQYPYVVQTRGNMCRTIDGRWVRVDGKKYEKNKALTHIPLEIYEFKGW